MIKVLIFDWGDTVMRDFPYKTGPMYNWDFVEWIPGLEEQLKILSVRFITCLASNAGESDTGLMIRALQRIDAAKYFNYFFTSKDLGFEKPDLQFFLSICNNLSCQPFECIMIGNDYNKDIAGAKNSGMFTIYFNENNLSGAFDKADKIINNMSDLISAIKSLINS
ncbi:MAG: HAD family hydrolase [Bacteroidales bacterium]|nr:HAD family hydrolase [Bacteroidales bacterium]